MMRHNYQTSCYVGKTFRIRSPFAFKTVYFDSEIRNPQTLSSPLFILHQIYLCRRHCWGPTHVPSVFPGARLLTVSVHAHSSPCLPPS